MALAEESALRHSPGGDVAGWIVNATLCSAVTAYAQHSEPGKDTFWGVRRWTSEMCQAEKGSKTECQREQQREKELVRERRKKKKGCAKWQKGRKGSQ